MTTAIFQSFDPSARGWGENLAFGAPESVHEAHALGDVPRVLAAAEAAALAGKWVAVFVAYEAAPAFDPAFRTHEPMPGLPLAWAAVFAGPEENAELKTQKAERAEQKTPDAGFSDWQADVSRAEHETAVRRIRDYIAAGDLYQANYTIPLHATFRGDPLDAFHALGGAQGAGYSAFLDLGPRKILCFSPELFFECGPQKSGGGVLPPPETPGGCHRHGVLSTPKVAKGAGGTGASVTATLPPPAPSATLRVKVNPWQCHSPEGFGERRERPLPDSWRVALASEPVDSRDAFLFHKTTRRVVYDAAREAHPAADDVILWNERGELTESCFANLVLEIGGERVTPPVECGLLAGVFRQDLLEAGVVREGVLHREDLAKADAVWLVNSVRGWIRAELDGARAYKRPQA